MPSVRVAVWYHLPSGGAKRALHQHVEALVAAGHSVAVWRPPVSPAQAAFGDLAPLAEGGERERPLEEVDLPGGSYLHRIRRFVDRADRMVRADDAHAALVAREIRDWRPDLLFAANSFRFNAPAVGRYLGGIPRLLYLQEPNRVLYEAMPELPWIAPDPPPRGRARGRDFVQNRALRVLARQELRNARGFDRILVNSFFSRESVLRAYGVDAEVCYLGVDTDLFRPTGAAKERFVVGLGAMTAAKNPLAVVRAVGAIPGSERPPLVWVGNLADEGYVANVQEEASKLNVSLDLRRMASDAEIVDLLSRAAVLAYSPRLEPFGYAPLEANACGTPAVVVAEGGVRETVRDGINGRVVAPRDLPAAIAAFTGDLDLSRRVGERGREYVEAMWALPKAQERFVRIAEEMVA